MVYQTKLTAASNFKEVLKTIYDNCGKIEFIGWINGFHVIRLNEVDYKVKWFIGGRLELRETRTIIKPNSNKEKFAEEYRKYLETLKPGD
jgi:hypothetical protein